MYTYNREYFFNCYRITFGKLTAKKVKALEFLLTKLEQSERVDSNQKRAYTLATIKWETADTFEPITEYGSKTYLKSKKYWPYIGRGYVQLTWLSNYRQFGNAIGIDLVNIPGLANDQEVAWKVLEIGMTDDYETQEIEKALDPNFTSSTLEDYFNDGKCDYENARKIINPKDYKSYKPIAEMANKFYTCLTGSIITDKDIPEPRGFDRG
jgi:hypothetical protein